MAFQVLRLLWYFLAWALRQWRVLRIQEVRLGIEGPEGPSTPHSRLLVPKTISGMVFGARDPKYLELALLISQTLPQRVHISIWYICRLQSKDKLAPSRPKNALRSSGPFGVHVQVSNNPRVFKLQSPLVRRGSSKSVSNDAVTASSQSRAESPAVAVSRQVSAHDPRRDPCRFQ